MNISRIRSPCESICTKWLLGPSIAAGDGRRRSNRGQGRDWPFVKRLGATCASVGVR